MMFVMDVEKFIMDGNFKLGKKNLGWDLKVVVNLNVLLNYSLCMN